MYDIIIHPTVKKPTKLCYNTVTHVNNWKTSPQYKYLARTCSKVRRQYAKRCKANEKGLNE